MSDSHHHPAALPSALPSTRPLRWIACALTLLLAPSLASAQRVTGRIIDAPSRIGVAGAVLTQLDARGQTLSRVLSGEAGRFTFVLDANARSVRVVRLGYVPRDLSPQELERGEIVLQRIPVTLKSVRVTARGCPARADSSPALALLDQARDGLLAAQVSRESKTFSAVRLRFERDVEGYERPGAQRVWIDSTADARTTFAPAPSAAELAERGFLEELEGGVMVMHAPDGADVSTSKGPCGWTPRSANCVTSSSGTSDSRARSPHAAQADS